MLNTTRFSMVITNNNSSLMNKNSFPNITATNKSNLLHNPIPKSGAIRNLTKLLLKYSSIPKVKPILRIAHMNLTLEKRVKVL